MSVQRTVFKRTQYWMIQCKQTCLYHGPFSNKQSTEWSSANKHVCTTDRFQTNKVLNDPVQTNMSVQRTVFKRTQYWMILVQTNMSVPRIFFKQTQYWMILCKQTCLYNGPFSNKHSTEWSCANKLVCTTDFFKQTQYWMILCKQTCLYHGPFSNEQSNEWCSTNKTCLHLCRGGTLSLLLSDFKRSPLLLCPLHLYYSSLTSLIELLNKQWLFPILLPILRITYLFPWMFKMFVNLVCNFNVFYETYSLFLASFITSISF